MHLHLAVEGITAKFQGNLFQISVLPVKHLEAFFHFIASEEVNQYRLNYPMPCMGLAQHQVIEDETAIIAFNKNLLFLGNGAWRGEEEGVYKTQLLQSHMNVGLKSLVAF